MSIDETNPQEHEAEVAHATARGRILVAAAVVIGAALIAAYQMFALPFLKAAFGPAPPDGAIAAIKFALVGVTIITTCAGALVIWYGKKIARHNQFPLPGAWVWRDTLIKRGPAAVRIAWLHYAAGALMGIICIALTAYLWIMLDRLAPHLKLPPGVTILQQRMIPGGK